jgi:hypothetical protein
VTGDSTSIAVAGVAQLPHQHPGVARVGALGALGGALATAIGIASNGLPHHSPWFEPLQSIGALGIVSLGMAPIVWVASHRRGGSIAARTLRTDGRRLSLRGPLRDWSFGPFRQGTVTASGLHLEDAHGRALLVQATRDEARRLLASLGLAPEQRRYTFRWRSWDLRFWSWLGTAAILGFLVAPILFMERGLTSVCILPAVPLLAAEVVSRWLSYRETTIGLDGIEASSPSGRTFVRFANVRELRAEHAAVLVETHDGHRHRCLADLPSHLDGALFERASAGLVAARARTVARRPEEALLERGDHSFAEWKRRASEAIETAAAFRRTPLDVDDLRAILADPTAPAERRLAAAIAVSRRASQPDDVRMAAQSTASPRMRVALEEIAEGEASERSVAAALDEASRQR